MIDRVKIKGLDKVHAGILPKVYTWFDNDQAGDKATSVIRSSYPMAIDMREKYNTHSDLNEWHMNQPTRKEITGRSYTK